MLVYTSITKSYLPKARVLAKSVKRYHPDWTFVLLYSDDLPVNFDLKQEPFDDILTMDQLGLDDWKSWSFSHKIVELCTAVKGPAAKVLAQRPNVDKIMYLDPDIKVFNSLASLDSLLDTHDILLTPHLLDIEQDVLAIMDNEISALKHGVYNLGFFAAKTSGQGLEFIHWWAERLRLFCRDDIPNGLFTDQRWCDLAPAFFSNLYIVRDKGCNVATWNIAHRPLSKDNSGVFFAGDTPLRFYHFTGYDSGAGFTMLSRYATNQTIAQELWDTYGAELKAEGQGDEHYKGWFYGQYENGEPIDSEARRLYQIRGDVRAVFPDPYSTVEPCFLSWWKHETATVQLSEPTPTEIEEAVTEKKSLSTTLIRGIISPSYGCHLIKSALSILKQQGISGLMHRIRNY